MTSRLLDRQARLLEFLSSPSTIFAESSNSPPDPALRGIDHALLRLEARFCCNKRIEKIVSEFPRTFELFGAAQAQVLREFVETIPQTTISTLANVRQFYEFLLVRWRSEPPQPVYLPDVAACEIAAVELRSIDDRVNPPEAGEGGAPKRGIRRCRSVIPLRCTHDVRSILEVGSGDFPPQRETLLIVALPAGFRDVKLLDATRGAFELLTRIDDWTDPRTLDTLEDLETLISYLAASRLIEVRD